jgi:hypothetical protein
MPLILGVLREPSRTSPDCVAAAAGCLKIVASRSPAAIELYEAEVNKCNTLNKMFDVYCCMLVSKVQPVT